jgi:DNA polymerase I
MDNSTALRPLVVSELSPPLKCHYISDEKGLVGLQEFFKKSSVFTIDVETNVTKTFVPRRIRTIQLGDKHEQYVIDLLPFAQRSDFLLSNSIADYRSTDCFAPIIATLRPVLESKQWLKVGHNLQFDYEMLKWCLGIRMWNLYDTMLAEKVLYAGMYSFDIKGFWALDDLVARYAGLQIDKSNQTSFDLGSPITEDQLVYCALDCRLPMAIKGAQYDKLNKANLLYTCQIEFDAIPAFGDMKLNGLKLDKDKWMAEVNKVKADHLKNVAKLDQWLLPIVGSKTLPNYDLDALEHIWKTTTDKEARANARKEFMACRKNLRICRENMDSYEGDAAINYGSNTQLLAALRKLGFSTKVLPDTNDRTLKMCAENPKLDMKMLKKTDPEYKKVGLIDVIRLYRETKKVLTTYGEGFIRDYIDPDTGLIHASIIQLAAETGRTSSRNPNIQNIPRGSDWRACFTARPGYKLITMDYNGCELRILAEYSREKVFIDAFLKGWDVHSVGAEIIFEDEWKNAAEEGCAYYKNHEKCSCKRHKELRDQIKAINFGIALFNHRAAA